LGVITRLNFRTFPLPPMRRMWTASFRTMRAALAFCAKIAKSPLQPRLLEVIDSGTARLFGTCSGLRLSADSWIATVEAAGHAAVVERHGRDLERMAVEAGAAEFVAADESQSSALFAGLCEFPRIALQACPDTAIFRIAS